MRYSCSESGEIDFNAFGFLELISLLLLSFGPILPARTKRSVVAGVSIERKVRHQMLGLYQAVEGSCHFVKTDGGIGTVLISLIKICGHEK